MNIRNLSGQRFGRLVASRLVMGRKYTTWACVCDCGAECEALSTNLVRGRTASCGCFWREQICRKHGPDTSAERNSWKKMLQRCTDPENISYEYYGGKGILVCERWAEFSNFLSDVGARPSARHSIGRIDNDGNYEPGNVRWETPQQQANNTSQNVVLSFDGDTMTAVQWASKLNINPKIIYARRNAGWPVDRILMQAVRFVSRRAS